MSIFHFSGLAILFLTLTGCGGVKVRHRDTPVAYAELPASIINSPKPSVQTREKVGTLRNADAVATLGRRLEQAPSDQALRLAFCEACVHQARRQREGRMSTDAIGLYLAAAEHSAPRRLSNTDGEARRLLQSIHNHATARVAVLVHEAGHDWNAASMFSGPLRDYRLRLRKSGSSIVEPGYFDELQAADSMEITGFRKRQIQDGLGGALVGYREATPERVEKDPFMANGGFSVPITALLDFGVAVDDVEITFNDLMVSSRGRVGGREVQLAGDFTAPIGRLMEAPDLFSGMKGYFFPKKHSGRTGLLRIEPFRRGKIPVVLVHGLLLEPATWAEAYNDLLADPDIRENFQFWFFLYTTAEPVVYNAARFRRALKQLHGELNSGNRDPDLGNMVVIGHSMGGLLTSFQIREGGDRIWDQVFTAAIDDLNVDDEAREKMRELVYFKPDRHIRRAVFIATPHLGSPKAARPISRFVASLVKLPGDIVTLDLATRRGPVVEQLTAAGKELLEEPQNSVTALQDYSAGLKILHELPISDQVVYHSIIGDRGKGTGPDSSDGTVPYYSSHLEGAASEKVIPSDHDAHLHRAGIEELRRILRLHLREAGRL